MQLSIHTLKTLTDWLIFLETRYEKNINMGLTRIKKIKQKLHINFKCPVIIVAGTNGKGSTCAILESILIQANYRVGLYTKPHFLNFNERARIAGTSVADSVLITAFETVESYRDNVSLTYFEFTTLAIMKIMADAQLDVVILEVGLGGRLDAVNVIDADISIVTSIDIDHVEYLGNSRNKIGFEKAGIYRAGKIAICGDPMPPQSLVKYAQSINANLLLFGRDFNYISNKKQWNYYGRFQQYHELEHPNLRGTHQLLNATGALIVLEALQEFLQINESAIRTGLMNVKLLGRFQILSEKPLVILDVAHNAQSAATLARNLDNIEFYSDTYAVFGCMLDKDIDNIINNLKNKIDYWCVTNLIGQRAASADQLKHKLLTIINVESCSNINKITVFDTPNTAFMNAVNRAKKNDRIIVFGSFLTVSSIMKIYGLKY